MNRREFISAGIGVFAISSAGRSLGALAPLNRVRLAVVGCREGGRGRAVLTAALAVDGVDVVTVCDVDSRAREWAAAYVEKVCGRRPRQEKDFRKLLEDKEIDGIISETPDHFHAYSAIMAMRAGKAVYVEKPCGYCPRECELIVETQKKTGMVFQMGNQRRASTTSLAAIDLLRGKQSPIGELKWAKCWYMANRPSIGHGKASAIPSWLDWDLWQGPAPRREFHDNYVHYNWHWFRHWGTAETGNNAPHFADISRWALGVDYPETVTCSGGRLFDRDDDYEWPDTFNMSFAYPGGKLITYELTSRVNSKPYMGVGSSAMIYGDHGSAMFCADDSVVLFDEKGKEMRCWKPEGKTAFGSLTNPTEALDIRHMEKFVECIRANDTHTNAPAEEAAKTSLMPLLANIALDTCESVKLDSHTGLLKSNAAKQFWAREYEKGWELA